MRSLDQMAADVAEMPVNTEGAPSTADRFAALRARTAARLFLFHDVLLVTAPEPVLDQGHESHQAYLNVPTLSRIVLARRAGNSAVTAALTAWSREGEQLTYGRLLEDPPVSTIYKVACGVEETPDGLLVCREGPTKFDASLVWRATQSASAQTPAVEKGELDYGEHMIAGFEAAVDQTVARLLGSADDLALNPGMRARIEANSPYINMRPLTELMSRVQLPPLTAS